DVKLAAKEVIRAPVTLSNVKLVLSLAAGKLQIRPFSSGIGGGTVIANLSLDSARTPAPVALDLTESNVEAGKLLQVLAGTTVLSGGRTNLKADVTGAGNSVRAIMAGLNGKLDYAMGSGSINNDFARLLLADLFRLFSFGSGGDSSNLRCVVAHFDINRGLATTRQLAIETSGATILGNGTVNLATEGLDIHLVPHATAANLANLAVPVIVGGTMAHPHVVPDAAAIATGAVGGVVTMPLTALSTIGSIAGFGGSGGAPGAGCGAAAAASQPGPAARQPTSPAGQILQGVGNGAKGAADTLKSLLP
ncbi:MAG TPA: AsmA-like C-terminal region-containing protein, partial [Dongiaceae bacterium]|nr:AsmA-like C-terminal region-containing protein [Dongiaceae bacterium]